MAFLYVYKYAEPYLTYFLISDGSILLGSFDVWGIL